MLFELLPQRAGVAHGLFVQRRNIGRRRRRRRAENILQHVLSANHGRGPRRIARNGQDAGMAQDAAALVGRQIHPPELRPGDAFDAVVLRQPLVQEGELGVEELGQRPILAQQCLEEHPRFVFIASRSSGPHSGNFCGSGLTLSRLRVSSH